MHVVRCHFVHLRSPSLAFDCGAMYLFPSWSAKREVNKRLLCYCRLLDIVISRSELLSIPSLKA